MFRYIEGIYRIALGEEGSARSRIFLDRDGFANDLPDSENFAEFQSIEDARKFASILRKVKPYIPASWMFTIYKGRGYHEWVPVAAA